ncbi:hypothetical protein B484DRAFT_394848 [Ochromonadaceae sp. CCMP2298]|nr:hypothetical protein B484DRAFT_394848 [Ochromonadaceae sp. CCMP2298]
MTTPPCPLLGNPVPTAPEAHTDADNDADVDADAVDDFEAEEEEEAEPADVHAAVDAGDRGLKGGVGDADKGDADIVEEEGGPCWTAGRASMEAVELAQAIDVYISAVRMDGGGGQRRVQVRVEFLGVSSAPSHAVDAGEVVQAVGYSAHMLFTPLQEQLLREEISELDDALALQLTVIDAYTGEEVGQASVPLWVMVEDRVNVLRQEVEVLSPDLGQEVGSLLVDVKGFRLLKKCAEALRGERGGGGGRGGGGRGY